MKVLRINYFGEFKWHKKNGLYVCQAPVTLEVIEACGKVWDISFSVGAKTDGLSVPKILRWFLKKWDISRPRYCLVGAVHDALYATKGFGGRFTREESDDILRGGLRCSHEDRIHASMADLTVGLFARRHWGRDEYKLSQHVSIAPAFRKCKT